MKGDRNKEARIKRFFDSVDKTDSCWNWKGTVDRWGYGKFKADGKQHIAHRFSLRMILGEIPKGMNACHRCDNRRCVNPDHLWLGTQAQNMRDMKEKGRWDCNGNHALYWGWK